MNFKLEFKYTKDEMEKLIRFLYKNQEIFGEKNFKFKRLGRLISRGVLMMFVISFILMQFFFYTVQKIILLSFFGGGIFFVLEIIFDIIINKRSLNKSLERIKNGAYGDVILEVCDENIIFTCNNKRKVNNIKECNILYSDDEKIYIRGAGIGVLYIPKGVFLNNKQVCDFIEQFEINNSDEKGDKEHYIQ